MESEVIFATINKKAIEENVQKLKMLLKKDVNLMAVVKADAYGHGAIQTARIALKNGANSLGVSRIGEAIELRNDGIDAPILIFGYTPPMMVEKLIKYDLIQTVYSLEIAKIYSSIACGKGASVKRCRIKTHLKVDTGMGRAGIVIDFENKINILSEIKTILHLSGIDLQGIYTHFASSDSLNKSYTEKQFERFLFLIEQLNSLGIQIPLYHAANSAAIIDLPYTHLDMVRAGIAIYGLYSSPEMDKKQCKLIPAMELKSQIIFLKKVPAGFNVSYGMTYTTKKPTIIATVPIGYADGYSRLLSSKGQMLVREQIVPVVGRVCMDQLLLDVGAVSGVRQGDEVVILGKQGSSMISADKIALWSKTINYEVVSSIATRVPKIYV